MNPIQSFLQRYLNFTPPSLVRTRAVVKAVSEQFGVDCGEDTVSLRGDVAFLRVDGMLKSEIALHKSQLLSRIKELGGGALADLK